VMVKGIQSVAMLIMGNHLSGNASTVKVAVNAVNRNGIMAGLRSAPSPRSCGRGEDQIPSATTM
jgi:hypothetical protein